MLDYRLSSLEEMEKLPASRNVAAAREQMKTKKHGTSRENGESIVHYSSCSRPMGAIAEDEGGHFSAAMHD